ncbi:ADC synthase [Cantharellus anzutake]|uniref:ADC synthase n=1 Tax=Cantharellus anzutake TaxID=1750568 RepID=UPI001906F293|nr:ADC synthase [Cantharellus anzutake]KAF8344160.1 ADC synthase [Cantharellus anzutake]
MAYLRLSRDSKYSFLLESVIGGENVGRYSFVGTDPFKVVKTGPGYDYEGDPLTVLEKELQIYQYVKIPEIPTFTGGAIGFVSYDCVQYFEPKTARPLRDILEIPEAIFMFCDTIVVFDHIFQNVKIVSHVFAPSASAGPPPDISFIYASAVHKAKRIAKILFAPGPTPLVNQPLVPPASQRPKAVSNVGKEGYEGFVTKLKEHIIKGDIIQAVPSQRLAKPTVLHPFNAYRRLRQVNPSPYLFYVDCGEIQIVGASPETLCRVENNKVYNHAIAGTVRRGKNPEEDEKLGQQLLASEKDRAEHIMLVDLARNDVNRVCQPATVKVDSLMNVEKFSHVMHLTSQVSGQLREGMTHFDQFFPPELFRALPRSRLLSS